MLTNNDKRISEYVQALLTEAADEAEALSGYSQRERKLSGRGLAQTLILGWLNNPTASLNQLAQSAEKLGISISAQGLQERLTDRAVMLMAALFDSSVKRWQAQQGPGLEMLADFKAVYVVDSSQAHLPVWLSQEFFNAKKQAATLKFHFLFNYSQGQLEAIEVTHGLVPDQRASLVRQDIQAKSLYLFDLGYFSKQTLQRLDEQGAYFVCRLQSQTAIYVDGQRCDVAAFAASLTADQACLAVQVGSKTRITAQLVMRRVADAVAQQRRAAAHKKAQREGYTCSSAYLVLLGWDMLLTNVPVLDSALVFLLYALRWQIELLFKACKSQLALDHIGHWSRPRIFCQFYARLIALMVSLAFTADLRVADDFELSFPKALQVLQSAVPSLLHVLRFHWRGWLAWLHRLQHDFLRFAPKNKRKKSPSSYRRFASIAT
jgi:hypothetical protein